MNELADEDRSALVSRLLAVLKDNHDSSDFIISAFTSAVQHYRRTSICTPFPSHLFLNKDGAKNFKALVAALEMLPSVKDMATESTLSTLPTSCLQLLEWLLLSNVSGTRRRIPFGSVNISEAASCLAQMDPATDLMHPSYLDSKALKPFKVFAFPPSVNCQSNVMESNSSNCHRGAQRSSSHKTDTFDSVDIHLSSDSLTNADTICDPCTLNRATFESSTPLEASTREPACESISSKSRSSGLKIAYHGTYGENLHSIIATGLQVGSQSRLKRNGAIFGEGIYLTTHLPTAHTFCTYAPSWKRSALGRSLTGVLVCAVNQEEAGLSSGGPLDPSIPDHYLLVRRADAIKPLYLLLYTDPPVSHKASAVSIVDWIIVCVVIYCVFLLAKGYLFRRSFSTIYRAWLTHWQLV